MSSIIVFVLQEWILIFVVNLATSLYMEVPYKTRMLYIQNQQIGLFLVRNRASGQAPAIAGRPLIKGWLIAWSPGTCRFTVLSPLLTSTNSNPPVRRNFTFALGFTTSTAEALFWNPNFNQHPAQAVTPGAIFMLHSTQSPGL